MIRGFRLGIGIASAVIVPSKTGSFSAEIIAQNAVFNEQPERGYVTTQGIDEIPTPRERAPLGDFTLDDIKRALAGTNAPKATIVSEMADEALETSVEVTKKNLMSGKTLTNIIESGRTAAKVMRGFF